MASDSILPDKKWSTYFRKPPKVMTSYKNWCEANGYEPKKQTGLSQSLAAHGLEVSIQKRIYGPSAMAKIARGVQGLSVL